MNDATLLLRQVHPSFVQNGRPSSQAFRPTPKDEQKLSLYDGDLISADLAFEHYVHRLRLQSAGVLAVSTLECQSLNLAVIPDPEPFPEHILLDFSGCSTSEVKTKSKILLSHALARDWLYRRRSDDS